MSDYCEVCESVAVATSSCPATDVIMVRIEVANATSSMVAAPQPQGVVVSAGAGTSSTVIDAYAVLVNSANAASTVNHTMVITELLRDSARGVSSVVQGLNQMAEAAANATDEILVADAAQLLVSAAQAMSSIAGAGTIADVFLESKGEAKSFASLGLLEAVTSSAHATGLIAVLQRRVDVLATSSAAATSDASPSGEPETYLLLSKGRGTSCPTASTPRCLGPRLRTNMRTP